MRFSHETMPHHSLVVAYQAVSPTHTIFHPCMSLTAQKFLQVRRSHQI